MPESPQLKPAIKSPGALSPRTAHRHDVNFQTVFPGWPQSFFWGILPVTSLGAVYNPEGYPSFNCESLI